MRPGRHGGMSSSELETIIARNSDFITILRSGYGEGQAGVHNSITGSFILGLGGGWLPEYSLHKNPDKTYLIRGWRNIAYELLTRRRLRPTVEIKKLLGYKEALDARDYRFGTAPGADPAPAWNYSQLRGH